MDSVFVLTVKQYRSKHTHSFCATHQRKIFALDIFKEDIDTLKMPKLPNPTHADLEHSNLPYMQTRSKVRQAEEHIVSSSDHELDSGNYVLI